jgi:hypothetical protein
LHLVLCGLGERKQVPQMPDLQQGAARQLPHLSEVRTAILHYAQTIGQRFRPVYCYLSARRQFAP